MEKQAFAEMTFDIWHDDQEQAWDVIETPDEYWDIYDPAVGIF